MFSDFDLTIQKIEGLGNISKTNCSIYLDYKEISIEPLSHLPITIKIPNSGILHLYINDIASKTQLASLSFSSALFTTENFYWLPLFLSPKNFLKALPPAINSPKIQFGVNVSHLPHPLPDHSRPDTDTLPSALNETELLDSTDLLSKLNLYQKTIKTLKLSLIQSEKTLKQKTKHYLAQINQLRTDLESEKDQNSTLQAQLDRAQKLLSDHHSPISDIHLDLKPFPTHYPENTQTNTKSKSSFLFESYLDTQVNLTLKRLNFQGLLHRCKDLNYKVGSNKTVTLTLKHGKVTCHDNISLENYIFHNCKHEIEDLLRQRTRPLPPPSSPSKSPTTRLCRTPSTKSHKLIRFNI